jgi:hypothetical protein
MPVAMNRVEKEAWGRGTRVLERYDGFFFSDFSVPGVAKAQSKG